MLTSQAALILLQVDNIQVPLIMAHGRNDVVVNPGESERMFQVSNFPFITPSLCIFDSDVVGFFICVYIIGFQCPSYDSCLHKWKLIDIIFF